MKAKCPCGNLLNLKPEMAGKRVRCPKCGQVSRIPKNLGAPEASGPAAPPAEGSAKPAGLDLNLDIEDSPPQAASPKEQGTGLDLDFGTEFHLEEGATRAGYGPGAPAPAAAAPRAPATPQQFQPESFGTAEGTVGAPAGEAAPTDFENMDFEMDHGHAAAPSAPEQVLELQDNQILVMTVGEQTTYPAMASGGVFGAEEPEGKAAEEATQSWASYFQTAWVYPKRGVAKWMIVGYAPIWYLGMRFGGAIPFGWIIQILVNGVYLGFLLQLIRSSALEPQKDPEPPEITEFWDSFLRPVLLVSLSTLMSFLPLVLVFISFFLPGLTSLKPLFFLLAIIWIPLYWPLAYLCAGVTDSFAAVNPAYVTKSLATAMPQYLVLMIVHIFLGSVVVGIDVAAKMAENMKILPIPFIIGIVGAMASFYFSMVQARLLGSFYYCYSHKFRW